MKEESFETIVAGFGGQGVLFAGNLLAQAAMDEGYNVTYLPEYGPEMRGGTCHCTVVISRGEIASPVVTRVRGAIIFNRPSFNKFVPCVRRGGYVVANASLIPEEVILTRNTLRIAALSLHELAAEAGNERLLNIVALGAFVALTKIVSPQKVLQALEEILPSRYRHLLPVNKKAFELGLSAVR